MKLTEVTPILEISPIDGADRIEKCLIKGWFVVIRKDLHKVGDLVCFVYPDVKIARKFLDGSTDETLVRLKTVRIKKVYSAGLVIPLTELPIGDYKEGDDVASLLGIEKYEAPVDISLEGDSVGGFPSEFIGKTDEDNARSNPEAIEELNNCYDGEISMTVKWNGRSATFIWFDGVLKSCSRSLEKKEGGMSIEWQMAKKYKLKEKFMLLGGNWAIQAEICGPKIQKNLMGLKENEIRVFHVKNLDTGEFFTPKQVEDFCGENYLPSVGIISNMTKNSFVESLRLGDMQKLVNSIKHVNGYPVEGVVFKTDTPFNSITLGKPWSLKLISEIHDLKN